MVGAADPRPEDVQATFCATLVDEWIALGVGHAVISPGSRSTPMALALTDRSDVSVHVVHDERSAAFAALGLGLDGVPALLLCTSGTAAANFYPAVVEAGLSDVPMIVLTADRPEELRGVGAPQTIDQVDLFGRHVVWSRDPGVPDDAERSLWRELAIDASTHARSGPVQLNLAFREPLLGVAGELPPRAAAASPLGASPAGVRRSDAIPPIGEPRGLILVGGRSGVSAEDVSALAERTGWPVVADPISRMRGPEVICAADALVRSTQFAAGNLPDVIARIGRPAASKLLAQWTRRATDAGAVLVQVGGPGVIDPEHNVSAVVSIDELLEAAPAASESAREWAASWAAADRSADRAIVEVLAGFDELTEPGVARTIADALPADADLVVASSMPIRDLEWFGGPRATAHSNRGANGIDGVLGTALGRALGGRTSYVFLGDLAFVHDSNALTALARRDADLRIVVVDNDGGGIFSFLPQAAALSDARFEQLFGTPLGVDIVALATSYGLVARTARSVDELVDQLAQPGPWVCRVPTDRHHNVEVHAELHAAAIAALDGD